MKEMKSSIRNLTTILPMSLLLGTAFAVIPVSMQAQGGQGAAIAMPPYQFDAHDISGYWELGYDDRSVPVAELTPAGKAAMPKMRNLDLVSERYCRPLGMPATMDVGRPLSIVQGKYEVLITVPANSQHRNIYFMDKHTSPDIIEPASVGESIAHWEGDTLVVDTISFSEETGRVLIPGGGYRTPGAHLVERYKLLKNGQVLSVTSTWSDPKVFAKPQTYEYWYHRVLGNYEPLPAVGCNAWDKERAAFIEKSMSPELKKESDAALALPGTEAQAGGDKHGRK